MAIHPVVVEIFQPGPDSLKDSSLKMIPLTITVTSNCVSNTAADQLLLSKKQNQQGTQKRSKGYIDFRILKEALRR